ncbi:MAG TPA: DUF4440 domain-containing protein [Fimbriimonadaceae bacterium]|nr:DUF4440 domain-containing protein [Fimbriimonadaceae bacterium]
MRLAYTLLLSCLTVVALAHPENPELRHEIQKVYRNWDKAVTKEQWRKVLAMTDGSFYMIPLDGPRYSRSEFAEMVSNYKRVIRRPAVDVEVLHVDGSGDEAVAWIHEVASWSEKRGRRWVRETRTRYYADTLKRTPEGWKFTLSQELPWDGK